MQGFKWLYINLCFCSWSWSGSWSWAGSCPGPGPVLVLVLVWVLVLVLCPGPGPGPWSVPAVAGFLVGVHLVLRGLGDLKQMLVGNWEGGWGLVLWELGVWTASSHRERCLINE
jgi:hypothetical protein